MNLLEMKMDSLEYPLGGARCSRNRSIGIGTAFNRSYETTFDLPAYRHFGCH